jgi:hypothetical protein
MRAIVTMLAEKCPIRLDVAGVFAADLVPWHVKAKCKCRRSGITYINAALANHKHNKRNNGLPAFGITDGLVTIINPESLKGPQTMMDLVKASVQSGDDPYAIPGIKRRTVTAYLHKIKNAT